MEPKKLSFLIKAVYDILPTPVNLHAWVLTISNQYRACGKTTSLKHILTGCEYVQRSYTWRHNKLLEIFEGNISKLLCKNMHRSLLDSCTDQQFAIDLEHHFVFPTEIALMTQHPDIVIWSIKLEEVFIIELTILFDENFDWAHPHKLEKYEDLQEQCIRNGWITYLHS